MSETSNHRSPGEAPIEAEVLTRLPRTRPQRASPRRARAQASNKGGASVEAPPKPPRAPRARKPQPGAQGRPRAQGPARSSASARAAEPVPPQGYESEDDSVRGPVRPPGSTELLASAAELAGELAKTGVNTGARLFKDLLSRLPG